MNLARFINEHMDEILREWEAFARTLLPSAATMDSLALRDHARQILESIARDIVRPQSAAESREKSEKVEAGDGPPDTPAATHGTLRHGSGFDLPQLFAEFRALRASVLRLWTERSRDGTRDALYQMTRFNEAVDQALAESVGQFSDDVAKSRDTFIAILGHDLRSPLNAVSASAAAMSAAHLPEAARAEALQRIRNSTLTMSQLVRDLLEYTRTRLGKELPIRRERIHLKTVLQESLGEVQAGHPQRSFRFELGGDLTAWVDAPRMQQAVTNLLSNALQHGRAGTAVKLVAREDGDAIAIEVTNQGGPIPDAALQVIFDPLVQVHRAGAGGQPSGSLGLGLFIAREIVVGHGGTIEAVSSDEATTFRIRVPRDRAPLPAKADAGAAAFAGGA